MKKNYLKVTLELLKLQIFFSVLSLIWFSSWRVLYSILTGWLFLGAIHSTLWQLGRKEKKNNTIINNHIAPGENPIKLSLLNGAKYSSIFFGINLLVLIFALIFGTDSILHIIYRFMVGPFCGFLPEIKSRYYWSVGFLLCVVMYIPCVTAYISGVYNISLTEKFVPKLIYKSKDKKD